MSARNAKSNSEEKFIKLNSHQNISSYSVRKNEDIIMFNKIWPKFITKIIMKVYVKSYDTYN